MRNIIRHHPSVLALIHHSFCLLPSAVIHFFLACYYSRILPTNLSITYLVNLAMASQDSRGSPSPRFPADYIAPSSDHVTRPYTTNLSIAHHTSVHSHMSPASLHMSSMNPNAGNTGYRREPKVTAEDNTQPRFELFLLGEGEKKVTEEADTRMFSYLSSSKPVTTCCFYMNSSIPQRSLLSTTNSSDIYPCLPNFILHPYAILQSKSSFC